LDITTKLDRVNNTPWHEIVPDNGLQELFETNDRPKHYIGLELSGFLHLGSLLSTGFKINDFIKADVDCTVFLADWHTLINDKLGGDKQKISMVTKYYKKAFEIVCPGVHVVLGSELYKKLGNDYWANLIQFTKYTSLARIKKTLTIMGRSEDDQKIDLAKMLYPPMQAIDIRSLDVDIAHAGIDQRKIHMLVRDIFPKLKWKVPVSMHHRILPSLTQSRTVENGMINDKLTKMSKSNPKSGIFMNDNDQEIIKKINKSWCEPEKVYDTPLIDIVEQVIFHEFKEITIETYKDSDKDLLYKNFKEFLHDAELGKIHPGDLKQAISKYLIKIISPIRNELNLDPDLENIIRKSVTL
jgi:tyrosyl-tRNA synthetase